MNVAQVIAALNEAAAPIVEHYASDLAIDAGHIEAAPPGSVFLWAPYNCGSRFVTLWRGSAANRVALHSFDLMDGQGVAGWHLVTIGRGDRSHFAPISTDEARQLAEMTDRAASGPKVENTISVYHL